MRSGMRVKITRVPERAKDFVTVGMLGTVTGWLTEFPRLVCLTINDNVFWWSVDDFDPHTSFEPDLNSLLYCVRNLVHADCGDDAVAAMAELANLEKKFPR